MPHLTFKDFLTEAHFSESVVDKVLFNLTRLIEKKIGQKLYRYGGANGFQEVQIKNRPGIGKGFLYFTPKKIAIRFNFVKGEFVSMSFWRQFKIGKPSDFYMDFGGANIVRIVDIIIEKLQQAIRGEKITGEIPLYLPESFDGAGLEPLTEAAKKVSPEEFYRICRDTFPNEDDDYFTKMHWRDIANAGAAHNLPSIPGYAKSQPTPGLKGHYSVVPPSMTGANAPIAQDDKIRYMKITVQDPVTKKFLSSADDKISQQLYAKFQNAITDNSAEMAKKEVKDPKTLFGALANLTKLVVKGTNKALLIYGGPGTGKSFTVTNEVNSAGLVKNRDWYHIKGKVSTQALYQTLFLHRKGKIIIFDDADSVFSTEDSANILKAALDSYDERYISWLSPRTTNVALMDEDEREEFNQRIEDRIMENPEQSIKYPSEFKYEGRIIFISNLAEKDIDTAVLSRAFKIDMTLTDEQMFMRMEQIIDYLGEPGLTREEKLDTLQILRDRNKLGLLRNPNMRTFVAASKIRASGIPNWLELLEYS